MFLIHGDRILLTNLNSRGWDLPGGHVEAGETAFDAMQMELWEETGATFRCPSPMPTHIR
ncbi:NUDIX domain-containing protein [Brevibacillus centrosporus]|uniref:NUDIX domain-containing protein n=1 Tax=Brevibacillus centrosporus TaxID=54910 RepID=UPI00399D1AFD